MNRNNGPQVCMHPVPENPYGVFAMHCQDNVRIEGADLKKILDGPIAAMEDDYQKTLVQTAPSQKNR